MKDAAITYAKRGLRVLPLQPRGKLPLTEHGSRDATSDAAELERWWSRWPEANVGIATGAGLHVIDLDGSEGVETWRALTAEHGRVESLVARTGSGGWHIYLSTDRHLSNTAKKLGPGIDTRGEGGYVVAPPSIHPNGWRYEILNDVPLAAVPDWLLVLLAPPARKEPPRFAPAYGATAYGRVALERMRAELLAAPEGARNDTLNLVAWRAGRLAAGGQIEHADCAQIIAAGVSIGLRAHEVDATFRSGYNAGLADDPIAPEPRGRERAPRVAPPRIRAPR